MYKILMICHGNICRSPLAEFIMKDLVKKAHLEDQFFIASAATSREEIGNPVYYAAKQKLAEHGISCEGKRAVQITKEDYNNYDYILVMEEYNIKNMIRIIKSDPQKKVYRLLDFTDHPGDIADPWYSRNFDLAYEQILEGCKALLEKLK
ncbi:Low molecular weight protein tyrosine phosphatase [Lachnospiraceae bacterium TWA4]|nr:Low molecular weight protein tyrosine phosphatase [Lachnospiraceae bacterium TWA4]